MDSSDCLGEWITTPPFVLAFTGRGTCEKKVIYRLTGTSLRMKVYSATDVHSLANDCRRHSAPGVVGREGNRRSSVAAIL